MAHPIFLLFLSSIPLFLLINPLKHNKLSFILLLPLSTLFYSASLPNFLQGIEISPSSLYFPSSSIIETSYNLLNPYHITNSYGLFRRITGVGGRPELIIKGSLDGIHWEDYILPYKPQELTTRPKFNIPYQPRLDWQMWFGALSNINNSYWFFTMLNRLFSGSEAVLTLFEYVPYTRPKFIKVELYLYNFTHSGEQWWTRKYVKDWLPSITPDKFLVEQWQKFGFPDPVNRKRQKIHPMHSLPLFQISTAVLSLKLFHSLFTIQ